MAEAHEIEREATRLLRLHLEAAGRRVDDSDNKTFDLIVDGEYAEVKGKAKPFSAFDFFYLSANQYKAVEDGRAFTLFLVCNVADPERVEIFEFPAHALRSVSPKCEVKYYYDKGLARQLLALGGVEGS